MLGGCHDFVTRMREQEGEPTIHDEGLHDHDDEDLYDDDLEASDRSSSSDGEALNRTR